MFYILLRERVQVDLVKVLSHIFSQLIKRAILKQGQKISWRINYKLASQVDNLLLPVNVGDIYYETVMRYLKLIGGRGKWH